MYINCLKKMNLLSVFHGEHFNIFKLFAIAPCHTLSVSIKKSNHVMNVNKTFFFYWESRKGEDRFIVSFLHPHSCNWLWNQGRRTRWGRITLDCARENPPPWAIFPFPWFLLPLGILFQFFLFISLGWPNLQGEGASPPPWDAQPG